MRALYVPKWQERESREDGEQSDRKEFDPGMGSDEPETPLPLTVTSRVCQAAHCYCFAFSVNLILELGICLIEFCCDYWMFN